MPLLKRKPVIYQPLPSLSTILQPIASTSKDTESTPPPPPSLPAALNGKGKKPRPSKADKDLESEIGEGDKTWSPPDADNDNDQLRLLSRVFQDGFANGSVAKGKKAGTWIVNGSVNLQEDGDGDVDGDKAVKKEEDSTNSNGTGEGVKVEAVPASAGGEMLPPPIPGSTESWKITDREVYYIPESGEIFTDYETYLNRMSFYQQPLYQCEVSGKSTMSYFAAHANERKETRQLHTRFPRQLKKAVLTAVQFQVEGKLEALADKIYERFVNRFFDDEKVFVDVQGDKYLARIVKTFPPRSLASSPLKSRSSDIPTLEYHPLAANLSLDNEDVLEVDDPMKYFYSARLIVEGAELERGGGEEFEGSVMEVQADKISRDRINFSRAMLKRFIRDCVDRDPAVYSPWIVKPAIAQRYGIPTEMSEEVMDQIQEYRDRQMDRRKREREERLGLVEEVEEEEKPKKRAKKDAAAGGAEVKVEEEIRKKPMKYPAEDFLVEYVEKDEKDGRIEVRPSPGRNLPFGDQFEKFLLAWTFLNVMGKPLGLSPFTIDEFEQSLYHKENASPPIMAEVHACLINALISDLESGAEAIRPIGIPVNYPAGGDEGGVGENDTDYWEGLRGATTETIRPIADDLALNWSTQPIPTGQSRKGWESSLVGLLWDRGTLSSLPSYLDSILHLTYEDKPAPTRPTWATAPPTQSSLLGLIPSKPEKRWVTLHHTMKLDILVWIIELVMHTGVIRDFMEESMTALTEVRKVQVDVKREWKKLQAELAALEPKKEANGDTNGDGDIDMDEGEAEIPPSSRQPTPTPQAGSTSISEEQDELETPPPSDTEDQPPSVSPAEKHGAAGASRRLAMARQAATKAEEEALRAERIKVEQEEVKAKKNENKAQSVEKRRLMDEEERLSSKLRELELDFRTHIYSLRSRPLGVDRFGNKYWWMDGIGSGVPLSRSTIVDPVTGGGAGYGTGRIYVQGVEEEDLEYMCSTSEIEKGLVENRRSKEEGDGMLSKGEWGVYDTAEQIDSLLKYLNPRGTRDSNLLKTLKTWQPEITSSIHRRRLITGLDKVEEEEGGRRRPSRRVAGGEEDGYLGWKNKRAV